MTYILKKKQKIKTMKNQFIKVQKPNGKKLETSIKWN